MLRPSRRPHRYPSGEQFADSEDNPVDAYTPEGIVGADERTDMPTIDLTAADFEETVTKDGITLVDFWADWCGPCKAFAPVYEEASQKYPEIRFGKVDTEAEQQLAGAANIRSIPTLMAFRDGILVFSQPGALPAPALEQVITAVQDLDMDDVRKQIAEAEAQAPQE